MWTHTTLQCQFLMVIRSGVSIMCLEHISKNKYLWPREWRKGLSSRCFEQDRKRQIGFWHVSCQKWIVGVRTVWRGSIDIWTYNCFQNVEESSAADEKDKTAKSGLGSESESIQCRPEAVQKPCYGHWKASMRRFYNGDGIVVFISHQYFVTKYRLQGLDTEDWE